MDIEVRELQTIDYEVLKQVDRSERVASVYLACPTASGLGLELERVQQDPLIAIAPWDEAGIQKRISQWQPEVEKGGRIIAAIQDQKIIGFGIIGPKHPDNSAELCALFISSEMRNLGVGTILFTHLEKSAKAQGASSLLIYSNPTESAVDFYRKQNCKIIGIADKSLVSHLPWDIVFAKPL